MTETKIYTLTVPGMYGNKKGSPILLTFGALIFQVSVRDLV